MKDAALIGVGVMGTALARTLLQHDYRVTVWNRTPEKTSALERDGAVVAKDLKDAAQRLPIHISEVIQDEVR